MSNRANRSKKRTFSTFESHQNDNKGGNHNNPKRRKPNAHEHGKQRKRKMDKKGTKNQDFFHVTYNQPDALDLDTAHCLSFGNIASNLNDIRLADFIRKALNKWHRENNVKEKSKLDVWLHHNRHYLKKPGFAYVYFEKKQDAKYILELSQTDKFIPQRNKISCKWQENRGDSAGLYAIDDALKGITKTIKISNLHWKTTELHLYELFNAKSWRQILRKQANEESDGKEEKQKKPSAAELDKEAIDVQRDLDPRWMRIMEDKNGYPKGQALVMLNDAESVEYCLEKLQDYRLLGRKLKLEYSSFTHEGALLPQYNDGNLQLAGVTKKLLMFNILHSVKTADIVQFLKTFAEKDGDSDGNIDDEIKDIYLIQNQRRVCGGKCFLEFDSTANACKWFELLQWKQLKHRTVFVEYGHLRNEWDKHSEQNAAQLREDTNRLFVANLAWDTKESDLRKFFGGQMNVVKVFFNVTASGFPKGSAFVTFENNGMAQKAYDEYNGKVLKQRKLVLDFASTYMEEAEFLEHKNKLIEQKQSANQFQGDSSGGKDENPFLSKPKKHEHGNRISDQKSAKNKMQKESSKAAKRIMESKISFCCKDKTLVFIAVCV